MNLYTRKPQNTNVILHVAQRGRVILETRKFQTINDFEIILLILK